jgi:hypothetical protein
VGVGVGTGVGVGVGIGVGVGFGAGAGVGVGVGAGAGLAQPARVNMMTKANAPKSFIRGKFFIVPLRRFLYSPISGLSQLRNHEFSSK